MDDKVDDMEIFSGSDCVSVLIGAGDIVLMLLAISRCPDRNVYRYSRFEEGVELSSAKTRVVGEDLLHSKERRGTRSNTL